MGRVRAVFLTFEKRFTSVSVLIVKYHIPMSYKEPVSCPEAQFWK
jgi:hypothetical protein